jgi:preprotein translocase subunit SecD
VSARLAAIAGCAVVMAGCGAFGFGPEQVVDVRLSGAAPAQVEAARTTLLARFEDASPGMMASVSAVAKADRIVLTFRNGAPAKAQIECLARRGLFRLAEPGGTPYSWLTEADIQSTAPGIDPGSRRPNLSIRLRPDAGARMQRVTSTRVGSQVEMRLDDTVLTTSTIQSAFGAEFQTTVESVDLAECVATVLASGPLPVAVTAVQVAAPAGR